MPLRAGTSPLAVAGALAIVYVVWGSTYTGIAYALESMPPLLLSGSRFLAAGAILYVALKLTGSLTPATRRHWAAALLTGVPLLALGNGGVVWAQQHVASGVAALLIASVPLWIAVLDRAVYGRRLNSGSIAGLALGFAGIAVLVNIGERAESIRLPPSCWCSPRSAGPRGRCSPAARRSRRSRSTRRRCRCSPAVQS